MKKLFFFALLALASSVLSAQAPAGISSGLQVWLTADAGMSTNINGATVSSWLDQSPNGNHATQNTASARPTLVTNAINGHPAIRTESNKFMNVNLSSISNQNFTIFAVTRRQSAWITQHFMGVQQASPHPGLTLGYQTETRLRYMQYGSSVRVAGTTYTNATEVPTIIFAEFNSSVGQGITCVRNGSLLSATNNATTSYPSTGQGNIGRGSTTGDYFTGLISEIIVYNRVLSATEKRQIQTYLSVKYGLTIRTVDHLFYSNEPSFANDMVGIGRHVAGALNQTTSRSNNTDDILQISNPSDLDDGEYLVCGNQNGSTEFANYIGSNCAISKILPRIWKARRTGDPGTVTLRFDMTNLTGWQGNEVVLMIDGNSNGFNDDQPIYGTYNAPFYEFSGINIPDGKTFTLAYGNPNWYAVASGNSTDAIWSATPSGTPQVLSSMCERSSVIIRPGVTVNNTWSEILCSNFTIQSGAIFNAGSGNVSLLGNLTVDGVLNSQTSEFIFSGTTSQTIGGVSVANMFRLTSNNSIELSILPTSAGVEARDMIRVNQGLLVTNNRLTLISNASNTGSIGPLNTNAVVGNVTVQRYHNALAQGWVNICSPIKNKTIQDWKDDFTTTGFVGSHFPPPYSFNNVQFYNEPVAGGINNGFVGVNNVTNNILDKRGYFIFVNPGVLNLDVDGEIYMGNQTLPVTYTNTGTPSADGWNLIANPYPCAIDWNSGAWTKTNINNAFYVWNAAVGQYASYINGIGTNGGSRYIPSSQSFFVVANAPSPVLMATEACKSTIQGNFKSNEHSADVFTLQIQRDQYFDETSLVLQSTGTLAFEQEVDAYKLRSPLPNVPYMATISQDGLDLSVNTFARHAAELIVPLRIEVGESGVYTIGHKGLDSFAKGACIVLEDLLTGNVYPLNQYSELELFLSEGASDIRFQLRIGGVSLQSVTASGCPGMAEGSAIFNTIQESNAILSWYNSDMQLVASTTGSGNQISGLEAGSYTVLIENNGVCGATHFDVEIQQGSSLQVESFVQGVTCPDKADGRVELRVFGGKGDYDIMWSHGPRGSVLEQLSGGEYTAFITDIAGCTETIDVIVPVASLLTSSFETVHQSYELKNGAVLVEFFNTGINGTDFVWSFGDGTQTSSDVNPTHLFNRRGLFEVTLKSLDDNCSAIYKKNIRIVEPLVQDATMAADIMGTLTDQGVQLMFFFDAPRQLRITSYNVLGQQLTEPIIGVFERQTMYFSDRRYASNSLVEVMDMKTGERALLRMGK